MSEITIFADGSGKASKYLEDNLKTIREREEVLKLLKLFIMAHEDTLAGMYWRVEYLDPAINLSHSHYRGQVAGPKVIAALWPEAKWSRVKPRFYTKDDTSRDWVATVNGVTLRIESAERYEPVHIPKDGPIEL